MSVITKLAIAISVLDSVLLGYYIAGWRGAWCADIGGLAVLLAAWLVERGRRGGV